ncbi:MAG: DNA recombination protein RmuC, partial [Bacteroidales bacterium]|nr:DNA recombination protein RmuC [Bacteroidales bacterium]
QSMADTCGSIYDKLLGFLETFENVGSAVEKAQEQYDKAKGQLISGKGNVVKRLTELRQKGINSKTKKSLPPSFEPTDE